jgi:hypothetical protein
LRLIAAPSYPHDVGPTSLQVRNGKAARGIGRGGVTSPRRNMDNGNGRSGNGALFVGLDIASQTHNRRHLGLGLNRLNGEGDG